MPSTVDAACKVERMRRILFTMSAGSFLPSSSSKSNCNPLWRKDPIITHSVNCKLTFYKVRLSKEQQEFGTPLLPGESDAELEEKWITQYRKFAL
jgi:hypothetical protein